MVILYFLRPKMTTIIEFEFCPIKSAYIGTIPIWSGRSHLREKYHMAEKETTILREISGSLELSIQVMALVKNKKE